ncbi:MULTISPECIES: glycosyltransferase family 2 protein [Olivibacter]|uniref:Glycosyltransferase family 2 protein n=1 Tax=Olivibacter jilunii TaxID=985016 RepID=A0ABW6B6T1_9SPHI|nr:glycosyltransferase family 2 protein [Pseudosphingobacterium sp.]
MYPSVSLIISTYNWPQALNLCLKSVRKQSYMPNEIIIADDGSRKETKILIDSFKKKLKNISIHHVWHEDEGFRKSLILNKAIKVASSDYIVQIDGDVILDKHFIKDHLSVMEKRTFVRGTRAHIKEELLPAVFDEERIHFSCFNKGVKNRFNAFRIPFLAWLFTTKRNSSKSVRGSNLAFWKADFITVNGYDNDLQGWGHEDEELAARLVNSGVMKKKLKLKAVQFHLTHRLASRTNEEKHGFSLRNTLQKNIQQCKNGYHEVHPVPHGQQFELA